MILSIYKVRGGTMSKKKNTKKQDNKNKQIIMSIIPLFIFVIILVGGTYSIFSKGISGIRSYEIKIGKFSFEIGTEANPISLPATYPMVDVAGKRTTPYTFKLTNSSGAKVNYTMELISDTSNTLPDDLIKIYIEQDSNIVGPITLQELTRTIYKGNMNAGESQDFSIRLWLDENATTDASGKTFKGKIKVTATQSIN